VSRRLTDTRQGRAAPTLSLRLTEAMAAAVERVRTELVAASPAGLSVSSSDAARVLLGEALAARAVPAAPVAPPRPLSPAVLAQRARSARITEELSAEIERARALPAKMAAEDAYVAQLRERQRAGAVAHTAAGGQLSLLTRTANDGPEAPRASTLSVAEVRSGLIASGAAVRAIADATHVAKTTVHKFLAGGDVREVTLAQLAGFLAGP